MVAQDYRESNMSERKPEGGSISKQKQYPTSSSHWPSTPAPIRRVFDHFPLARYSSVKLPQRARLRTDEHILYIFTINNDKSSSNLSCNPACLRWQAFLKFNKIQFSIRSSNNHASPSGALPFLIPSRSGEGSASPIVSSKIAKWISSQGKQESALNIRHEAYSSLIEQNIRNAWLYHLYLDIPNFRAVARPLYITAASSNFFVRIVLARQLQQAAQTELLKSRDIIDREEIYDAANKAFSALSTLLGDHFFFSTGEEPGLFDASIFAYTHLILDERMNWQNKTMQDILERYPKLVYHRNRLWDLCLER